MGGYKALLLATCAGTVAMATPAVAQDGAEGASEENRIVVTGSRISRDLESNAPLVTVDEALLRESSTAALESNLNRLPQFVPAQTPTAGGDIQPTATNTPGAATVSLRGIGANRTLVLLDGRRSTPSNASGVTDISTIPAAAIERVEVISGGASATYGADAVAGVTNFILKRNFQGLELDAQLGLTQEGDGFEYQFSGIMGTDFDDGRGNVSIAMSVNTREANYQRDRSWYAARYNDPNVGGNQFFLDRPAIDFGATPFDYSVLQDVFPGTCIPGEGCNAPVASTSQVFINPDGTAFTTAFNSRGGTQFFNQALDGYPYKQDATGAISQNNTDLYLVLPLTRYNMFARGNYELNDHIGIFAQGLFSHVHTYTRNEPGPITGGWGVAIDPTGLDRDQLPDHLWTLLDSRSDPNADFQVISLMPDNRETDTDVMTYNFTAGLEGSVPGTDWTWEAFVNHGESHTFANQTGIYSLNRLRAVMQSGNFGEGFEQTGNADSGFFGASTATCTSGLNLFNPPAGGFSEDCLEAVRADLKNRSKFRQTIVETNLSGGLFELPAGQLRAAVGASYREADYEFLNDTLTTQGRSFQDQALGIYPSGNSAGYFDVKEIYGELLIPLLADIPAIQELSLEVGGRISDYSTTGTSYTYKALGDWRVTDWLRIRGGYNRAERAPNIGELFLAPQQTFGVNNVGDICSTGNPNTYSANSATNSNAANVQAMCTILINQNDPTNTAAFNFYGGGPNDLEPSPGSESSATVGFAFPTTVGNPNLRPETADTWTAGIVVNSPFTAPALSRLRLTVDWFKIAVDDAIGVQSIGVAQRSCFDPAFNPLAATDPTAAVQNQFCQNITRNIPDGNLGNVLVTYANNGRFRVEGIDAALDWAAEVGPGTLSLNALVNYMLNVKVAELPVDPLIDYVGTQGPGGINGLNGNIGYEYRLFTSLSYRIGGASLGLQWQHYPSVEDTAEASTPGGTPTTGYGAYNLFNLNGSYQLMDSVNLRFGVDNLFNKAPPVGMINVNNDPALGQLPGGTLGTGFYDTIGRRFYMGANIRF